jgi:hypothetical protein
MAMSDNGEVALDPELRDGSRYPGGHLRVVRPGYIAGEDDEDGTKWLIEISEETSEPPYIVLRPTQGVAWAGISQAAYIPLDLIAQWIQDNGHA